MALEGNNYDDLRRQNQIANLLKNWDLSFSGKSSEDPEIFLSRLQEFAQVYSLTNEDLFKSLPAILRGEALDWQRLERNNWQAYRDFALAFLNQYGKPNPQESLLSEVHKRIQRKNENITSYVTAMRKIFDKFIPRLELSYELDLTYNNLHPDYLRNLFRYQFSTFAQLQELGKQIELRLSYL